ncbi:MAG: YfcE family phosphodiesterase [Hyphomonadaceae bacterium]|nr:YfcE family phosphodiesterase [Clostridia bacterium]
MQQKIAVFSDSHGNWQDMVRILQAAPEIRRVIFLGDVLDDIETVQAYLPSLAFDVVKGNCDGYAQESVEKCVQVGQHRLLLTHGHTYRVKSGLQLLVARGRAVEANAIFFGHTHCATEQYEQGMLVVNPGSMNSHQYAEVTVDGADMRVCLKRMEKE